LAPVFYIAVAKAIINLNNKKAIAIALLAILLLNSFALYTYHNKIKKPQWKEAAHYIKINSDENPTLLFDISGNSSKWAFDAYFNAPYQRINLSRIENFKIIKMNDDKLLKMINQTQSFWLIKYRSPDDHFNKLLEKGYEIELKKEFDCVKGSYKITVYRLKKR